MAHPALLSRLCPRCGTPTDNFVCFCGTPTLLRNIQLWFDMKLPILYSPGFPDEDDGVDEEE